jgi:hypothetical protein
MSIRPEVQRLVDLGPFPASQEADPDDVDHRGALLSSVTPPVTREEAAALLVCFGADEAFGLAWALVHLIESGPLPLTARPADSENEWIRLLWDRAHR